jgi:integrase
MATGLRWHGRGWQIRIQIDGQQRVKTVYHPNTQAGRARAEKDRRKWLKELRDGRDYGPSPWFGNVCQTYLDTLDVEHSTELSYANILNNHWMPPFSGKRISDIRALDIKTVLAGKDISRKTKKNVLGPLRGVFDLAVDEGWCDSNPVPKASLKRHQKPQIETFTRTERKKILGKLDGQQHLFFQLMFDTGMRPSELLALHWEDFDGDAVRVEKAIVRRRLKRSTKNHEVRSVYITGDSLRSMTNHPDRFKGGYIFRNSAGGPHLDTDQFNKPWREALRRARVPYRIPYTCRHTRASELLTAGIEPAYAARQLGHTVEMFLRTYANWIDGLRDTEQRAKLDNVGQSNAK